MRMRVGQGLGGLAWGGHSGWNFNVFCIFMLFYILYFVIIV